MIATLDIRCPKCRGKVLTEEISSVKLDLVCVSCGKRDFISKKKFQDFLKKKTNEYRTKARFRELLSE